ncbi:MAG TPA: ABC transporter ATP-binding protein [Crenalkalicoccus sp.]|nr:ABC transporter ATP-binding protein [Crenalkalicoccus sp.]
MLEVEDLHAFYGEAHIVQGASLTVQPGEVVALLGRNGMGKTTLIRALMGFAAPAVRGGAVRWRGESLLGLPPHAVAARRIAIVPQGRRLFPSLTVTEHLILVKGARAKQGWTVEHVFGVFPRLAERRHHRGSQLSGGERQMLALGRALMLDPELLLMDEPSEGLAPAMVQRVEDTVIELRRTGLAILMVEQNLYSALTTADRIYVLESGRIVLETTGAAANAEPEVLRRHLGVR